MSLPEFVEQLNEWGSCRTPFLFVVDFELEKPFACTIEAAASHSVFFDFHRYSNAPQKNRGVPPELKNIPGSLQEYSRKFDRVMERLRHGDSFLANLTVRTQLESDANLSDLFAIAVAPYKLLFQEKWLAFSPETFVRIKDAKIFTYPMKGTRDAADASARESLLADRKEMAEHVTIVDLMRNDLSQVATGVRVLRFRYLDEIRTNHKNLLQMSSEIAGDLPNGYENHLGSLLAALLPAGSVSGAPKTKTLEVIRQAEGEKRGYYAGVFGYFDGRDLDSAVTIRYVERINETLYYRSGGGITTQSEVVSEYREMLDKIYVPVD